jgi:hypothetical protein
MKIHNLEAKQNREKKITFRRIQIPPVVKMAQNKADT